jgi:hypothetical protein
MIFSNVWRAHHDLAIAVQSGATTAKGPSPLSPLDGVRDLWEP